MTNPYEQFVAPKQEGQPTGNPYSSFIGGKTIDESEQKVLSTVNNPKKETPAFFGLAEVPSQTVRGLQQFFNVQVPIAYGAMQIQQGEKRKEQIGKLKSMYKGKDLTKISPTQMMRDYMREDFDMSFVGSRDFFNPESKAPDRMIEAGKTLIKSKQKDLQEYGLARSDSPLGGLAFDAGSGLGSVFIAVGTSVLARDPKVGASFFYWLQNSASYKEARDAGKSPEESRGIAMRVAGATSAVEMVGGRYFLGAAATSGFMKKVLLRASGQAAEESTQGAIEEGIMGAEGVRNKTFAEQVQSVAYQGLVGFISGAPVSAVVSVMEETAKSEGISTKKAKEIIDNIVKNKDKIVDAAAKVVENEAQGLTLDQTAKNELKANLAKMETPSVERVIEPDYTAQAKSIKEQLSTQIEHDLETSAGLKKALGYQPESLSSFIKRTGGITDIGGELKARGITNKNLVGLIKKAKEQQSGKDLMGGVNENAVVGNDAVKQRVFDAGYFPDKTDYNQISDSELYDAIAADRTGKSIYTFADQQKIDELRAGSVSPEYERLGITKDMTDKEIAKILRENDTAPKQTQQVTPDMNDPRFSGELDLANSSLNEKTIKSKKQIFEEVLAAERNKASSIREKFSENISDLGRMVEATITPISTRMKKLNPKLASRLRKFEFDRNNTINKDQEAVRPFLEKYNALKETDRVILDFAMRNGDAETINQIAEKNGMTGEIAAVRSALDGLYKRANEVGLDIGYKKNFFPRYVTKPKKLLEYFEKTEAWGDIQQAITSKENEIGRFLEPAEKAYLINTLLRGYKVEQISLARPGALKQRMIDVVTPEINTFYGSTDQAIIRYITAVNDAVETRKFFGKGAKMDEFANIEDSIGYFVLRELEKGTIKPSDSVELAKLMKARFARGEMSPFWRVYRNISYIDTMGSPISAVTQLGDLAFAFYKSGVYRTLSVLPKAAIGKSEITKEDIGVSQIAQEFEGSSTTAKAVQKVFKIVGLEKMDAIGKETLINAALKRYRAAAKKPSPELREHLDVIFGEETDSVIQDLQNGVNSENVKLLLFNELLDMQPVSLSEMPEVYLRSGNGRIFYMLKTYTVKQFDIYRREVFDQIKTNPVQGMKNLTRLLAFFVTMNASADYLKDLLLNRDTPVEDAVINNIFRIFGLSKYHVYSARREGIGTAAFKVIAPPFKAVDSAYKDMAKLAEDGEIDPDEVETLGSVPIAGKMLYWWFGAGANK